MKTACNIYLPPFLLIVACFLFGESCQERQENNRFPTPISHSDSSALQEIKMSRDTYFDKVYGMLLGSAIGDAMGAPTEM